MKYDFLVIGHTINVQDKARPLDNILGNALRAVGIAQGLLAAGFKVALIVDYKSRKNLSLEGLDLIDRNRYLETSKVSERVILSTTKPSVLIKEHGINLSSLKSKSLILLSCFVEANITQDVVDIYNMFDLITVNNVNQLKILEKLKLKAKTYQLDFGINQICSELTVSSNKIPNALWVGCIRSKEVLNKIILFAESFPTINISIVSRLIFDKNEVFTLPGNKVSGTVVNLLEETISSDEVLARLSTWCDRIIPHNIKFLGGAESNYSEILTSHDIGLDFCESTFQLHDNTKILDYLSAGMFIFTEKYAPSHRYVNEFNSGIVLNDFDLNTLMAAFSDFTLRAKYIDRNDIIKKVFSTYSWNMQSEKLITILSNFK